MLPSMSALTQGFFLLFYPTDSRSYLLSLLLVQAERACDEDGNLLGFCRRRRVSLSQLAQSRAKRLRMLDFHSAFGGLIATGVSYLSGKGGLHGWQWLVRRIAQRRKLESRSDSLCMTVHHRRNSCHPRRHICLVRSPQLPRVSSPRSFDGKPGKLTIEKFTEPRRS